MVVAPSGSHSPHGYFWGWLLAAVLVRFAFLLCGRLSPSELYSSGDLDPLMN
jgi:hypothetical protein